MNRRKLLPLPLRVISGVVAVVQIFVGTPVRVCAEAVPPRPSASPTHRQPSPSEAAKGVRVNRTIPDDRAPSEFPRFSGEPTAPRFLMRECLRNHLYQLVGSQLKQRTSRFQRH